MKYRNFKVKSKFKSKSQFFGRKIKFYYFIIKNKNFCPEIEFFVKT